MSEQEFKGRAPKSATGESIYFYSMDVWFDLHGCLEMLIDEGFPPYPAMDSETTECVAEMLQRRLDFGLVQAYYELKARQNQRRRPLPLAQPQRLPRLSAESKAWVEMMLDETRRYIDYLRDCGGCDSV